MKYTLYILLVFMAIAGVGYTIFTMYIVREFDYENSYIALLLVLFIILYGFFALFIGFRTQLLQASMFFFMIGIWLVYIQVHNENAPH